MKIKVCVSSATNGSSYMDNAYIFDLERNKEDYDTFMRINLEADKTVYVNRIDDKEKETWDVR